MRTSKQVHGDPSSSRRAQPLRQTRNNPPRSSIPGVRPAGSRGSIGGGSGQEEIPVDIFPAITHFADAITALPRELVRHFTLLKEVEAKVCAPEEELAKLVEIALNTSPPLRNAQNEPHYIPGSTSAPMSILDSANGSIVNGHLGSVPSVAEADNQNAGVTNAWDASYPRQQIFRHCAYTMQHMLVSLDEKNHVISTAVEALSKQLARIDDCFPHVELEVSEEARNGSTTHWAYPENRVQKTGPSRREIASANNIAAAVQHVAADEAAARSDARKQALLDKKKGRNQQAESDFDEQNERNKEKRLHGNTKVRKPVDVTSAVGLGITNGTTANGNPRKRLKVEHKGPGGGTVMERSISSALGNAANTTKAKVASPRETPAPEAKKRSRNIGAANGHSRKRNGTVSSIAMSPSLASSPIRSTFPEPILAKKPSPPPTTTKPPAPRGRQNSTQSTAEKRAPSVASNKQNSISTPDLTAVAVVTGKSQADIKATMKETGVTTKGEPILEETVSVEPTLVGAIAVGARKDSIIKRDEADSNGDAMQGLQTTTVTMTKSGRASKPSTPAIPSFPEPVRARSSRAVMESAASNKRSHKKGAGAAAQLLAQQTTEADDSASNVQDEDDDGEVDADEPLYCYCNNVSYGEMVGCDADGCEREWFHLECVGLKVAPKINVKWYCDDCKEKMKHRRFGTRP